MDTIYLTKLMHTKKRLMLIIDNWDKLSRHKHGGFLQRTSLCKVADGEYIDVLKGLCENAHLSILSNPYIKRIVEQWIEKETYLNNVNGLTIGYFVSGRDEYMMYYKNLYINPKRLECAEFILEKIDEVLELY